MRSSEINKGDLLWLKEEEEIEVVETFLASETVRIRRKDFNEHPWYVLSKNLYKNKKE